MSIISVAQATKLVDALRSGKYRQEKYYLETYRGCCVLGVACKELAPNLNLDHGDNLITFVEGAPEFLKKLEEYSFGTATGRYGDYPLNLSWLNDNEDLNFDELADIIQAEFVEPNDFGVADEN